MKQKIKEFVINCLKITNHDNSATMSPIKGSWKQFDYVASYGKGAFAHVPWFGFFAFNQIVTNGIYPVILYNTQKKVNNFEICYGVSAKILPSKLWNIKYTNNLAYSNTAKYNQSFVKKAYTINTIEEFEINANDIIMKIESILEDFAEQFNNDLSVKKKVENTITINSNKNEDKKMVANIPLNQILYGPPGTGKTYNTIIEAVKTIEKDNPNYVNYDYSSNYQETKRRFEEYKTNGQVQFVTFHQSYSYEEFVEGIKPKTENGQIQYNVENGIFKKICDDAQKQVTDNFDEVYEQFIEEIVEFEDINSTPFTLKTSKNRIFGMKVNSNNNLTLLMGENLTPNGTLTKENLKNLSDWKYYARPIKNYLIEKYNLKYESIKDNSNKPYVLIIDEINRGNISKIFGELITLIEEDKRIGKKHELMVQLPYSQKSFGVPKNLYIIGTMNTSDRSIASIDIALRRRFKFKEMMPNSDIVTERVGDIILKEIFNNLNTKIKILLDRDHQIGHSYFVDVEDEEHLKQIWFDSIIPLLNEYFYGDWEKLKLVIPGFIKTEDIPKELQSECDEKKYYEFKTLKDVKNEDFKALLEQKVFKENNAE